MFGGWVYLKAGCVWRVGVSEGWVCLEGGCV